LRGFHPVADWVGTMEGLAHPKGARVQVLAFLQVIFQEGAWKQGWPEAGRITYKATQDRASVEIVQPNEDHRLRFRVSKGTKVIISGDSIHLPDSLR
jgi:hypothetical protein